MSNSRPVDPDVERIYKEWFYKFGAMSRTAEQHPFSEWARDNYPEIYSKMLALVKERTEENKKDV